MVVVKISVNRTVVKKITETGNRHDEFKEISLKFDLKVCG